ncbi:cytochrome P450 monooxygenase-like protein [Clohesyomyces aquaticus]|uniref:Cytochrome P450 monooxygenase-like protein n=1 Tax=Clohesyomyces aquaticus TaxID=1231657 RepID=A0A1Y1Y9C9_9PLEO|nr:cytochrome P450 monooxygenase-like protein [Clohesyomyces aquaticus]
MKFAELAGPVFGILLGLLVARVSVSNAVQRFNPHVTQCVLVYSYRLLLHPLHRYPGPFLAKITDWYSAYHAIRMNLHFTTYADHAKYGPVIRQGPNKLVFSSVQAAHDVLQNERLFKSRAYLVTQVNPTIFNLFNVIDTRLHRTKRRIIGQGISEKAMRRFEPVMHEQVQVFLAQLARASKDSSPLDMSEKCSHLGLDISGEIGFGHGFELQTSEKNRWMPSGISTSNRRLNVYVQFPALRYIGWEKLLLPVILPKVMRFHRMVRDKIRARLKEDTHSRPDLLSSIHDYKDPDTGSSMSKRELWSEATFLIPAGGDTTASLLAASFFYLSHYPKTYQRLATEIRERFSSAEEIRGGVKLAGCAYLHAFITETLRISPPSNTTLWRDLPADAATNPVIIDGHVIPPGTRIGVNLYCMHRNPTYFPDPRSHRPERWIREESGVSDEQWKIMHDAFIPFSLGPRNCAGKAVAWAEVPLVLAKTLWYFDFWRAGEDGERLDGGDVFYMLDQLGSRHTGPVMKFRLRDGVGEELVG